LGLTFDPLSRKYEEISPPNVEDFCYITDNTYMKQEVCVLLFLACFASFRSDLATEVGRS
jgi:hypothetical protein